MDAVPTRFLLRTHHCGSVQPLQASVAASGCYIREHLYAVEPAREWQFLVDFARSHASPPHEPAMAPCPQCETGRHYLAHRRDHAQEAEEQWSNPAISAVQPSGMQEHRRAALRG